jgi:hypothetical protein
MLQLIHLRWFTTDSRDRTSPTRLPIQVCSRHRVLTTKLVWRRVSSETLWASDVTYFQYIDGPQIFALPISEASGYTSQVINAVKTKKAGWEVGLTGSPIRNADGLNWDVMVNWSTYKETLEELPEGTDVINGFFRLGDRLDKYD